MVEAKNGGFLAAGTVTVYAENEGKRPMEKAENSQGQESQVVAEPSFFLRTPNLRVTNQGADFRVAVSLRKETYETHAYVLRGETILTYQRTSRASYFNTEVARQMVEGQMRKGAPVYYAGEKARVSGGTGVAVVPD